MTTPIGFRPTAEDERILTACSRPGETTTDTLRRALRLLDYDNWLAQARDDARRLQDENVTGEPEAW
jgi:antitoxin ParD1/3/4